MEQGYFCSQCSTVVRGDMVRFQNHMRRVDHLEPFVCGQQECRRRFTLRASLYRHIRNDHEPTFIQNVNNAVLGEGHLQGESDQSMDGADDLGVEAEGVAAGADDVLDIDNAVVVNVQEEPMAVAQSPHIQDAQFQLDMELKKSAALSLLNMRGAGCVTNVTINNMQKECFDLLKKTVDSLKDSTKEFLASRNVNEKDLEDLINQFKISDPFKQLKTKAQQMTHLKNKFGLVPPKRIGLGFHFENRLNPLTRQIEPKQVPDSFQYVSIIETLKAVLSDPHIFELINQERPSEDHTLRSFLDGEFYSSVPDDKKNCLRIQLYYDDLEIASALGPNTGIYKLAAFYFSVQNLPPEVNSLLSSIFVTTLAYTADLKNPDFGFKKILEPFILDMKKLEEENGYEVELNGRPFKLHALLVALCADNLGANDLLGFVSPSGKCFCRYCTITREEMWENGLHIGEMRTPDMHYQHLIDLAFGVLRQCHLANGLRFFKACLHSAPDAFHDFFQGINKMEVKLALREYVCIKKYFTVEKLNSRVKGFDYGSPDSKNKPRANFTAKYLSNISSYNLQQTGSQMWCLTRAFGFLFGDLVPRDDKFLLLIGLLNQIMMIVFSRVLRETDLTDLEGLIKQHHEVFLEIFPPDAPAEDEPEDGSDEEDAEESVEAETEAMAEDEAVAEEQDQDIEEDVLETELEDELLDEILEDGNGRDQNVEEEAEEPQQGRRRRKKIRMINKHHLLLHYVYLMRMFGPLINYWTMRYEAKHLLLKTYAAVLRNFQNIPLSMAEMLQMKAAADRYKGVVRKVETKKKRRGTAVVDTEDTPQLLAGGLGPFDIVCEAEAATVNGITFSPKLFVSLENSAHGRYPLFAEIVKVYVCELTDSVHLLLKPWKTVYFQSSLCAFLVVPNGNAGIVTRKPSSLAACRANAVWSPYGSSHKYISLRSIA